MQELETLLNSLIKMGWKPYSQSSFKKIKVSSNIYNEEKRRIIVEFDGGDFGNYYKLCDVASINSGLWRFVCTHSLISEKADMRDYREDSFGFKSKPIDPDGEYRIIRSALVPEEELGQFLIDNIKTE